MSDFPWRFRPTEVVIVLGVLVAVCQIVFGDLFQLGAKHYAFSFIIMPFLMWATARYGPSGVTSTVVVIALLALWGTHDGYGPLVRATLNESLLLLQAFLGVTTLAGLSVAAILAEWQESKRALEESEARYHDLYDNAPDMYASLDAQTGEIRACI